MPELPVRRDVPPPLTVAASLVAVEGIILVMLAIFELADLEPERRALGISTAVFFGAYGVLLGAAALALRWLRGWPRGPVLITQLIMLGLAWNLREHGLVAGALAVAALIVIAGMVHPASIGALNRGQATGQS